MLYRMQTHDAIVNFYHRAFYTVVDRFHVGARSVITGPGDWLSTFLTSRDAHLDLSYAAFLDQSIYTITHKNIIR